MMKLSARVKPIGLLGHIEPAVWRVCDVGEEPGDLPLACLVADDEVTASGYRLYLTQSPDAQVPGPVLQVPADLAHLAAGDIIGITPDGRRISVLWKQAATHNGLLLTEQCDNYCLMCSQPPKDRDDAWLFDRAKRVVSLLPPSACSLGLTGGEPTLHEDALIDLLEHCRDTAPWIQLHLLSNGRRFADVQFASRYARVGLANIMVGIPVYAPEPGLHDFIVQAQGAFEETIRGILNLASLGQSVEIRIVVQRHTVPVLADLALFIARNLPFIDQVALMGLEMTGLARPNSAEVWIDPAEYQLELFEATQTLAAAHIVTRIYNHQLCVLDERLWPYAVRSISDWKNDYLDICQQCSARDPCGGVFTTSGNRLSQHLRPILPEPSEMRAAQGRDDVMRSSASSSLLTSSQDEVRRDWRPALEPAVEPTETQLRSYAPG
jgi:His-Xaa-Ser system radical SAM maturase HxsC